MGDVHHSREVLAVGKFAAAALVAAFLVGVLGLWSVQRSAVAHEVDDAMALTRAVAEMVLEPTLTDAALTGSPSALREVDRAAQRILDHGLVGLKLWDESGTVRYSTDPALVGQNEPLSPDQLVALREGTTTSGVTNDGQDDDATDLATQAQFGPLLEVYQGLSTQEGTPLLLEGYLPYAEVQAEGNEVLQALQPALAGGLLLLFLTQVPLAWRMARSLEEGRLTQEALRFRVAAAEEVERRRIAADLHDSVVQSLVGSSYTLAAAADDADAAGAPGPAAKVRTVALEIRQGVRDLRTLIVSLAPQRLHDEGIAAALQDLLSPLELKGIEVTLDVDAPSCSAPVQTVVFRIAQEALRNVARHSRASHVQVSLVCTEESARLVISDDGVGFPADAQAAARSRGSMGLFLMQDMATSAGGHLDLASTPGSGTTLTLEVPA